MFDRYELRPGGATHYHTITENRAPTDESVRLLKEMETAARDKVQASIRVENCPVDCVLNAWEDWQSAGDRHFAIKCRINGKDLNLKHVQRWTELSDTQAIADALVKMVSEAIAREMLGAPFSAMMRKQGDRL